MGAVSKRLQGGPASHGPLSSNLKSEHRMREADNLKVPTVNSPEALTAGAWRSEGPYAVGYWGILLRAGPSKYSPALPLAPHVPAFFWNKYSDSGDQNFLTLCSHRRG